jgi:hypothetical protein
MNGRFLVSALVALFAAAALAAAARPAAPGGSFTSSDPEVNAIWAASVRTARDMVAEPVNLLPGCGVPGSERVILDGVVRDRCEFTGDLAVTGMTLYAADGASGSPVRDALYLFASRQRPDGLIPPTPGDAGPGLVDYTGYWIEDVYDYVLYSGDVAAAKALLPNVERALDGWYPAQMTDGLFADKLGPRTDYALIDRLSPFVAYYNEQYIRALGQGAALAAWAGDVARARLWRARAAQLRPVVDQAFWDPAAGAYKDTTDGPLAHSQDGNVFAILAGIATHAKALSALAYYDAHCDYVYGNSIIDVPIWDGFPFGYESNERVYPFMGYFELLARFQSGLDVSALNLIRNEWGYMLANGPKTTMWESIGPFGGPPPGGSFDHGWSSGAAPALTAFVLGVQPLTPGFGTFAVKPHPGGLQWARGVVPTPHGPIRVQWRLVRGRPVVSVTAPKEARRLG